MVRRAFYESQEAPVPGVAVSMRLKNGQRLDFSRATFSVGRLVLQVATYDSHVLPSPGIWVPHLDHSFRDEVIRIWPLVSVSEPPPDTSWPPPRPLDDKRLIAFRDRQALTGTFW